MKKISNLMNRYHSHQLYKLLKLKIILLLFMKANCTFLEVMMVKEITAAFVFLTRGEIAGSNKLSLVGLLRKGEMDTLQL
jgi:hypothetical protein